jgi:hypothetical protein
MSIIFILIQKNVKKEDAIMNILDLILNATKVIVLKIAKKYQRKKHLQKYVNPFLIIVI